MKYKLKKDLPFADKDSEVKIINEIVDPNNYPMMYTTVEVIQYGYGIKTIIEAKRFNEWIEEVPSQQIENFGTIDYWEEKFKQRLSPNYEIWSLPIQYYYNIIIAAKHLGMRTILFSSDCPHVRIAFDGLYKEG